ncbi:MAG: hypothetical protein K0R73_501 [Candidatus Midichloriaceae bacterium]|nr:hypothetical protein [Candidatus Midichloriaceae bacterium]
MQEGKKHIAIDVKEEQKATRWYDNPDISDFMFAMFSLDNSPYDGVCIHTLNAQKKAGLNKFSLKANGKWYPEKLVESLNGRIVYHPILTASTTDKDEIKEILEKALEGIDRGENGIGAPSVIIIPILMHTTHFGTLAIQPPQGSSLKYHAYYFNPLGTLVEKQEPSIYDTEVPPPSYEDEENLIFSFLRKRYGEENIVLTHNDQERWQIDGDQCGPFAIWFVEEIAKLATNNKLTLETARDLLSNRWEMGVTKDDDFQIIEGPANKCTQVRAAQAALLQGLTTNFSTWLFIQVKQALKEDLKDVISYEFTNLSLQEEWNKEPAKIEYNGKWVRDLWGIDLYELQNKFKEKFIEPLLAAQNKHQWMPDLNSLNPYALTAIVSTAGAVMGAAISACIFKAAPVSASYVLSSCHLPPSMTSAIIAGSAIGTAAIGLCTYASSRARE